MENIFYIIIGILWVAFKIYQGMQKNQDKKSPRKPRPATSTPQSKPNLPEQEFEDYIEKFFGVQTEKQTPAYATDASTVASQYEEMFEEGEAFNKDVQYESVEYQSTKETKVVNTQYQESPKNPTVKKHPLAEDFDLKKAVIYSEILKPKYF
jgi:hypothetical protein